jgi:chemotaxis regulatin CheY-phosphate phosphatase CheZ
MPDHTSQPSLHKILEEGSHLRDSQKGFGNLIDSLRTIVPLLDGMKSSLEESTNKIPRASHQLNSVTQATESATVEILNAVETMTQKITSAEHSLGRVKEIDVQRQKVLKELRTLTQAKREQESSSRQTQLETFLHKLAQLPEEKNDLAVIERSLAEAKADSMNIAMALQVQDITSQQIAGVSQTIESVRQQLGKVLNQFDGNGDLKPTGESLKPEQSTKEVPFDGEAHYTKSDVRQNNTDALISQWTQNNPHAT